MPDSLSPTERSLRARIGGLALHAQVDSRAHTEPARRVFLQRFEDQVDPDRTLPEEERRRRAELARRAYFAKLALRSAQVRRARREGRR